LDFRYKRNLWICFGHVIAKLNLWILDTKKIFGFILDTWLQKKIFGFWIEEKSLDLLLKRQTRSAFNTFNKKEVGEK